MDIGTLSKFVELGLAGVAVVGLFALVFFLLKAHKKERDEWRQDAGERHQETTAVLKELTTVIDTANRLRSK